MTIAMLLAAGRGNRLKPLTDRCPKPLCRVGGHPLIVHHIYNLSRAGIKDLVINHAWLGGKIRRYLGNGSAFGVSIHYSPEPPGGLETGGGIYQALPMLGTDAFICVNADIFTDFDFSQLLNRSRQAEAELVLVDNPKHNPRGDFELSGNGYLRNGSHRADASPSGSALHSATPADAMIEDNNARARKARPNSSRYTFAGIARYLPSMFADCKTGRYSIAPLLRDYVARGKVQGRIHRGVWFDVGCEQRLQLARATALQNVQ